MGYALRPHSSRGKAAPSVPMIVCARSRRSGPSEATPSVRAVGTKSGRFERNEAAPSVHTFVTS